MNYTTTEEGKLSKTLASVMENNRKSLNINNDNFDKQALIKQLGKKKVVELLKKILLIRNFELRAEAAYQQGHIGGFFHAYMGQEAIQTACVDVFGPNNWWSISYRCHALPLLLGEDPKDIMSELFGKANGNAMGRGGSMHLYSSKMLGGFGIVAGQTPIALGAALSLKYLDSRDEASFCYMGDGAVVQGIVYESLNLAKLCQLPCIFVIENNQWGMGTAVKRAVSIDPIGEKLGLCFDLKSYTLNGMDLLHCHQTFQEIKQEFQKSREPIIIEAMTERFRGHSISDPGNYRSREAVQEIMSHDVILTLKSDLIEAKCITEDDFKAFDKEAREIIIEAVKHAENSPWPDPIVLEEGVFDE